MRKKREEDSLDRVARFLAACAADEAAWNNPEAVAARLAYRKKVAEEGKALKDSLALHLKTLRASKTA